MKSTRGVRGARWRRSWFGGAAVLAALTATLAGCGGGGGSPTSSSSTSNQTRRQQIGQGNFTLVDSATAVRQTGGADFVTVNITTTVAGMLEATVEWTLASNDLDVYFLRGTCNPSQALAGTCGTPFAQSESVTAKPERLSATGLAAGNYTLVISSNLGNSAESGTFQVFLTPS